MCDLLYVCHLGDIEVLQLFNWLTHLQVLATGRADTVFVGVDAGRLTCRGWLTVQPALYL